LARRPANNHLRLKPLHRTYSPRYIAKVKLYSRMGKVIAVHRERSFPIVKRSLHRESSPRKAQAQPSAPAE